MGSAALSPWGTEACQAPPGLESVKGGSRTTFPSMPRGAVGRGGEGGGPLPGWRLAAASAVCLLPAAPVRECQAEEGTQRPPRPRRPAGAGQRRREGASDRPTERPARGGAARARSGGPHERAVSGEAAAGASRRGGDPAMDWLMG